MHDPSLAQVQPQCQKLFKFWVQPCSPCRRILLNVNMPTWVQFSPLIFWGRIHVKQTYPLYCWLLPALSSIYCGLLCSSTTRLHHNVSTQSWVREIEKNNQWAHEPQFWEKYTNPVFSLTRFDPVFAFWYQHTISSHFLTLESKISWIGLLQSLRWSVSHIDGYNIQRSSLLANSYQFSLDFYPCAQAHLTKHWIDL